MFPAMMCQNILFYIWNGLIYLQLPEEVQACGGLHLLAVQVESQNKHCQDYRGHDL